MPPRLLHMGTLGRPHGIRGEITVRWHGTVPLLPDAQLWLQEGNGPPRAVRPLSLREHRGTLLLALEGVGDRTAAETMRGARLLAAEESLPPLDEDEAYVQDLLGADVFLPDGGRLGRLDHVLGQAGQDVWCIATDDGREVLFPAQPCFIAEIDVAGRRISIAPPEGLLDVYR